MSVSSADAKLVRAIGTRELTASIINVTIASSIFLMPATVAERLGPAAPLAYLVCATLMTLMSLPRWLPSSPMPKELALMPTLLKNIGATTSPGRW